MGTRGALGFVIKGEEKLSYNHFDSYPEGLGFVVLEFLRQVTESPQSTAAFKALVENLKVVSDETPPTAEQIEALAGYTNLNVGTQTHDWYSVLRETQGDPGAILRAGYIEDGHLFPLDSLFCEWAYVIDLDKWKLEVYAGFQKELPTKGRWAGRPTAQEDADNYAAHLVRATEQNREPWEKPVSEYKAVERIALYSLNKLPSNENFLKLVNRKTRSEDE